MIVRFRDFSDAFNDFKAVILSLSFIFGMLIVFLLQNMTFNSTIFDQAFFEDQVNNSQELADYNDIFASLESEMLNVANPFEEEEGTSEDFHIHDHAHDHADHEVISQNVVTLAIADAVVLNLPAKIMVAENTVKINPKAAEEAKRQSEARAKLLSQVAQIRKDLAADNKKLQSLFKSLNRPVSKKFLALRADISASKVLKTLNMTPKALNAEFPNLKHDLEKLYRLRVFASLLPIHRPIKNARKSSNFGPRKDPFTKKSRMHSGIDYAAPKGTPLYASGVGVVKYVGRRGGYGKVIEIYHGNNIFTRYAHLSKISVKKGQRLINGQKIGAVGSTGRSTGAHLHYEIRVHKKAVNPNTYLEKRNDIYGILNKY